MADNDKPVEGKEVPLGKELDWTDKELDGLSVISVEDMAMADQLVKESLDETFADILDAEDDEEDDPA